MDKPLSFYAFELLYWCGLRLGELLALTSEDFDFEKKIVRVTKSYQRINGQDIVTDPKTPKSNRIIQMPDFLVDENTTLRDVMSGLLTLEMLGFVTMLPGDRVKRNIGKK